MRTLFLSAAGLALMTLLVHGQANSAPVCDDPMAGLNLGDAPKSTDSGPPSRFVAQLKGHLLVLDNDAVKDFDASTLSGVRYWAFYYSASWCPPCRTFTPQLVDFYHYFKKSHPNFELIFVGNDGTQDAMIAYMKEDRMEWPSMKYPDLDNPKVSVKKYFGPGIPDLVLTDSDGKVLSDTFVDGKYTGALHVIDDIKKMVPQPGGE